VAAASAALVADATTSDPTVIVYPADAQYASPYATPVASSAASHEVARQAATWVRKVLEVQRQAVSVERQEVPETPEVMQVRTLGG